MSIEITSSDEDTRKMKERDHFLIIGGGMGGLASALLLAKKGHKVQLFEAHTYLGGCAGYFRKGQHFYPAGATTLSGLRQGRPLAKWCEKVGLALETISPKTSMIIGQENKKILQRSSDIDHWIAELQTNFPSLSADIERQWTKFQKTSDFLWPLISEFQPISPKNFLGLIKTALSQNFQTLQGLITLIPDIYRPLSHYLKFGPQANKGEVREYLKLIDEQLMITAQARSNQVPAAFAMLGLCYSDDTHYPKGGMAGFIQRIEARAKELGVEIYKREKVEEVCKKGSDFVIKTQKGRKFTSQNIICNLPLWNIPSLLKDSSTTSLKKELFKLQQKFNRAWGANSAHFLLQKNPHDCLYYQLHITQEIRQKWEENVYPDFQISLDDLSSSRSLFFSLAPEEESDEYGRVPGSVSTHINIEKLSQNIPLNSQGRISPIYQNYKKSFEKLILLVWEHYFGEHQSSFEQLRVATPQTFERYTGRYKGRVGGLPFDGKNLALSYPQNKTQDPHFYRVGDTVFPGQGVVGVVTCALNLEAILESEK